MQAAGGKGWEEVFSVNSYHVSLTDEALNVTVKYLTQFMPDRKPLWNALSVPNLALPEMQIEIVVKAFTGCSD